MGKIAHLLNESCGERERLGAEPGLGVRTLAAGDGWAVEDVVCTYRPNDASFEERHARYRVALVGAGTFNCRGPHGRELLTPGSLLLGNVGESFECGHEHGAGDRCLAFAYAQEMFERLAFDAGARTEPRLRALRVPPVRELAPLVADAGAAWTRESPESAWDELAVRLAAAAVRVAGAAVRVPRSPVNAERGVVRAVRLIERDLSQRLPLAVLAREASLSPFHFVRAFARSTGLTPHRYLLRARLRRAAVKLATNDARVVEVAQECGFGDLSSFNHAFRAEFGATPRAHRKGDRSIFVKK
ncbi:MAG TPA: AraC family transcriptional regulator [Gammaproteobacteria bacterium]